MKIANINPKNIFRSRKKSRSVSRSDTSSFSSGALFSDSSDYTHNHNSSEAGLKTNGSATPTSVLPTRSHEISADEWSSELCELVQAFKVIDRDGDGKITRAELGALLSRVGADPPSEEELSVMLSEVDRDGDGCISLEELGAMSSACEAELREAFDFFDADHDGKITAEELLCVFTSIGDGRCTLEDCRRMISGVDKNNDGFVCLEDFTKMMGQQR